MCRRYSLYHISETDAECQIKLNYDLNDLNKWLKTNKLKLNEYNMNNNSDIKINSKIIEKVEKIKYHGFIKDKGMNFIYHMDYICKKIAKKKFNSIVKPHLEFSSTVLYKCCTNAQIERSIIKYNRYTPIQFKLVML